MTKIPPPCAAGRVVNPVPDHRENSTDDPSALDREFGFLSGWSTV
ncbi:MAG: hypothetical protein A4E38_00885 [Methanoregulaceae archaeon PtaB.Bin108]|nr:MAG: hypothetical protein A4E38_00885 [Methanoregulaceae archaeon PtaB.Bin108]